MRAPALEPHDLFEGIGAHELNPRFDWIPEEHGDATDSTQFDPPDAGIVMDPVQTPALARAQGLLHPANMLASTIPYRLDGGDTSHYQYTQGGGSMSIGAGMWWWMHKAAQSTGYRDPTVNAAIIEMFRAGVEIPGTYLWGSSTTDPQKQAANWIGAVPAEYRVRLVWMGDMEEGGLTVELVVAIYEAVEDTTHKPCSHYTGLFVSGGAMFLDDRIRFSKYGPRPIIVAAYVSRERFDGLITTVGKGKSYSAHQYSSNGPVPNVVGRCDMNEVLDKQAFLVSLNGGHVTIPNPTPITGEDMPCIIECPSDSSCNPFILDAGYATGIDGTAAGAPALPVQPVEASTWHALVDNSNALKARDAALAAGLVVNVPPITVPAPTVQFPAGFTGNFT